MWLTFCSKRTRICVGVSFIFVGDEKRTKTLGLRPGVHLAVAKGLRLRHSIFSNSYINTLNIDKGRGVARSRWLV
jgi:hypothetical protein